MGSSKTRGAIMAAALVLTMEAAVLTAVIPGYAVADWAPQAQQTPSPAGIVRSLGTIQAMQGNVITLKMDSGTEVKVLVQDSARMIRIEPGQKTLRGATPIKLQDLQVGDRILVAGKNSNDSGPVLASSIIVMKRSDIQQNQQREVEDWQKNSVGGLVKRVDVNTGTIVIAARVRGLNKAIAVHTSKDTILRRYAPDSVSFEAAKPGNFAQIIPGDQLRARGNFSADGNELAAAEIVSGSFRNIAGKVLSVDSSAGQVTVMDLITKKPVVVRVTAGSELRKLPDTMARTIALRLKGGPGGVRAAVAGAQQPTPAGRSTGPETSGGAGGASHEAGLGGAQPDFDQMLNGLAPMPLADLQKGDAVMIVSTEGAASGAVTAIKLVSGVEPILSSSPAGHQAAALQSLWNGFSTSGGGAAGGSGSAPSTPSH